MMIHDVTALAGKYKDRRRVGRGEGSGHGKTSGRGAKGAGSRSGNASKIGFEGGQMRYFRRLPKFGFTNAPFKIRFWTVNLSDIIAHPSFTKGGAINSEALVAAGLVRDDSRDLKILGNLGKDKILKVKLTVEASRVTAPARKLITDAGGSVNETGTRKDMVRGIDRNSDDKSPTNLTKKLHRGKKKKPVAAAAEEPAEKGADKGGKADKPEKPEKPEKPAKAEKAPKADKAPKGE